MLLADVPGDNRTLKRRTRSTGGWTLWVALGVALLLGLAVGLALTWGVWPVQYYDTDPVDLRAELKQDELVLISASYAWNEDLGRAQRRLIWLGFSEEEAARSLTTLVHRYSKSEDATTVRSLSKLAYALGARDNQVLVFIVTPTPTITMTPMPTAMPTRTPVRPTTAPSATPTVSATPQGRTPSHAATVTATVTASPTATETPAQTATPTETAEPMAYRVSRKQFQCRVVEGLPKGEGLLEVRVRDASGKPLPGKVLSISSSGGDDQFFTGLKPDEGLDYADFQMQPGWNYALTAEHQSQPVNISFRDEDCITDSVAGAVPVWEVVFQRSAAARKLALSDELQPCLSRVD